MISFEDFEKVELRVGTVLEAEEVEGSEKLIKLTVDLGEESPRIVLTGLKQWKTPADFKGRQLVFAANLEPRKIMGIESQGMLMAADPETGPVLLVPETEVPAGTNIR
ncbi:MAG: methionine--tRNA ligase [Candidatus Daviesbacteria bacterium]|nr:methionine--tRNA ligase [Candidatus Daviesbacteria bacterium]